MIPVLYCHTAVRFPPPLPSPECYLNPYLADNSYPIIHRLLLVLRTKRRNPSVIFIPRILTTQRPTNRPIDQNLTGSLSHNLSRTDAAKSTAHTKDTIIKYRKICTLTTNAVQFCYLSFLPLADLNKQIAFRGANVMRTYCTGQTVLYKIKRKKTSQKTQVLPRESPHLPILSLDDLRM